MKKAAYGTRIYYTDPGDSSMVRVHWVADINGPGINMETVDVTTHDSPDGFNEFVPGMLDGADVTFDLIFDGGPEGHQWLLELVADRPVMAWRLLLPRPEVQVIPDPGFSTPGSWTDAGAWSSISGQAIVNVASPAGADVLSLSLTDMLAGETYRLEVVLSSPMTGEIEIEYDGALVGTLDSDGPARRVFEVTPTAADGDLTLTVTAGPCAAAIDSVSLYGIENNVEGRFDFSGILTAVGVTAPVKDALKASVTIKVTGVQELAPFV